MARCTAPRYGHRTASGRAACPVCGGSRNIYGGYGSTYASYSSPASNVGSRGSSVGSSGNSKPRWSRVGSSVLYTPTEVRALTPVRESIERRVIVPEFCDVFLCHAWDDRKGAAKELHDLLEARGVKVWFSEKDVYLGSPLLREIDKGLAKSRVGIVLVTPAFLKRIEGAGISEK